MRQTIPQSRTFAAALALGLALLSGATARAQDTGQPTPPAGETAADEVAILPDDEAPRQITEGEAGEQDEQMLRMAVGACYGQSDALAAGDRVTVAFSLDDEGRITGIPDALDAGDAGPDARQLFVRALTALDECAPYPTSNQPGTFEAVFAQGAVESVRRTSTTGDDEEPSLRQVRAAIETEATEASENALSFGRSERTELQRRLKLIGFDPRGVDGVFGENTRVAISEWQDSKGFPVTGYLNAVQLVALNAQSQADYAEYEASKPAPKRQKRRVRVCGAPGLFGLRVCRYEYR